MEKMRMESLDGTQVNVEKIASLFPNCVMEAKGEDGKLKKVVNFDMLRQMLSGEVIEGDEAYEFTWVGKKAAIVEANKPIRMTLRPCPEESVNWDCTENLYIEGENLDVLKLLQESYLGKVKLIYIDPPYNTGHDFIYPDTFVMDEDKYFEGTGYLDDDGNINYQKENSIGSARFHSDWCSMIYSRLLIARNFLSSNGVIAISINDNELKNLIEICDEVFGERNRVGIFTWLFKSGGGSDNGLVVNDQEYVVMYAQDASNKDSVGKIIITAEELDLEDEIGKYRRGRELNKWGANSRREDRPTMFFPIPGPNGEDVYPIRNDGSEGCWRWGKPAMLAAVKEGNVDFSPRGDGTYIVYEKIRIMEDRSKPYRTFIADCGTTADGSKTVKTIFDDKKVFDFPKPLGLMEYILKVSNVQSGDIVMDFFSGSATTAQAVLEQNAICSTASKFIMVQIPEKCAEDTEAAKAGYKNICEIGKERIRRVGKTIQEHNKNCNSAIDVGFRVFKLDDSNMKDVYYSAEDFSQKNLLDLVSNIKEERTSLDLLFGCFLEWGLPLSLPYTSEQIEGCTVHTYNDGDLIACFDENIPDSVIKEIARRKPLRAVFRDSSFADSPSKINVGEIFKLLAPETRIKVL